MVAVARKDFNPTVTGRKTVTADVVYITDHISGPGSAVGLLCLCVSVL